MPGSAHPGLQRHLEDRYGTAVTEVAELDEGVFRVDRSDGPSWVARVFGAERPLERVEGDAEILVLLARGGFPAERCAHEQPVSEFDGSAVLVTGFLEDHGPLKPGRPAALLGGLLGRLHQHAGDRLRAGGAWHHLTSEGGPREEVAAAAALLEETLPGVGVRQLPLFDQLRDAVEQTDDCHDLPHALVHPDFVPANTISTADQKLVVVDWTGCGRGPRLWSLGFLLWAAGARHPRLIDVVAKYYGRHTKLEPEELERIAGAIRGRPVMLECWSYCHGRRELATAVESVTRAGELADTIAVRAREAFG